MPFFAFSAFAQNNDDIPPPPPIEKSSQDYFGIVQDIAEYPGGDSARSKFLGENLIYPDSVSKYKIQGRVYVSFIVEKNGIISDVKTVGKPKGFGLEEESLRVDNMMPNWTPGKQNGNPVRVKYILPISFKLTN